MTAPVVRRQKPSIRVTLDPRGDNGLALAPHPATTEVPLDRIAHRIATHPLLLVLAASALGPTPGAQERLHGFFGSESHSNFGWSARHAGDVDADGFDDVVVAVPWKDDGSGFHGWAEVYSGRDGTRLFVLQDAADGDFFGYEAAGAGDVNGDGYADLIVGAHGEDTGGVEAGAAYVFSGKDGTKLHELFGDGDSDWFGYSVAGAGDVNGDGFDDVVVGAPEYVPFGANGPGYARVFSGKTGALLRDYPGDTWKDIHGISVAGAGDVDGDGYDEIVVGAMNAGQGMSTSLGRARVYSGRTGAALFEWFGESLSGFGLSVDGAGDVTGDGVPDVIVGAPQNSPPEGVGYADVYSGSDGSLVARHFGDQVGFWFGWSVSGAGDVDGDGYGDYFVGAPLAHGEVADSGFAKLFSGQTLSQSYVFKGEAPHTYYGFAVDGGGDVNGDGAPDPVVASWGWHGPVEYSGGAFVYSGFGPARTFGEGCHGADVGWLGAPVLGTHDFTVTYGGGPAGAAAVVLLGASGDAWGSTPLPLDLAALGAPGCTLLVSPDLLVPYATGAKGTLELPLPLPAGLPKQAYFAQVTVLAPQANPLGVVVSDGLEFTVE